MNEDNILKDVWLEIRNNFGQIPEIKKVIIGKIYLSAFTTSSAGVAYQPFEDRSITIGKNINSIIKKLPKQDPSQRALTVAYLNAICALDIKEKYKSNKGDPLDSLDLQDKVIVTVGRFPPLVTKYLPIAKEFRIIERKIMEEEGISYYSPNEQGKAFQEAQVAIITGTALIFGGMEQYLKSAAATCSEVIVLGPTVSMYPGPFFKRGATIVGGIEITNLKKLNQLIKDAGTPTLIKQCARKIYFLKSEN